MAISDAVANTARAAHDVGLAAWLGGAMFGKFALNPSLTKITNRYERGSVANAAWGAYNVISTAGLGTAALGWAAARFSETRSGKLTATEQKLSQAKDGLMATAVLTGVASGLQGARLANQTPDGAVPIETGTQPAPETPGPAAKIQRSLGRLSTLNVVSGVALIAVNGVLAQMNYRHPPAQRVSLGSASHQSISPAWWAAAIAMTAAVTDQARRQLA